MSERDNNNWFAMSIIRELLEEKQVEKEIKDNKTKYKIPGRVYIEMPEVLEDLLCRVLKARLRALGLKVGGNKAQLIKRIRDQEEQTRKLFEEE